MADELDEPDEYDQAQDMAAREAPCGEIRPRPPGETEEAPKRRGRTDQKSPPRTRPAIDSTS